MTHKPYGRHEDLVNLLRQNPEYRRAERRTRPYADLVIQIVNRRGDLNLTQADLAARAITHQSRVSKIETGEHDIRLSTLIDIAEALDCEVLIQLIPFQPVPEGYISTYTGSVLFNSVKTTSPSPDNISVESAVHA